jgi:hypothetical protein
MILSNDQTDAVLNTLGEERAAAWARFYAIEVDSRPVNLSTIGRSRQPRDGLGGTGPFETLLGPAASYLNYRGPPSVAVAGAVQGLEPVDHAEKLIGTNKVRPG